MNELNGKTSSLKESPEDSLLKYRMEGVELKVDKVERRIEKAELKVEYTVGKDYLERAIGDMKEGIAQAVGEMKTSVAETKTQIILWVLSGTATIFGLGLIAYKLLISNTSTGG